MVAGGGSRVGGRHREVDRSRKRMGSGFFGFGLLLFFLASGTESVGEYLPQGPNRLGGRQTQALQQGGRQAHKGHHY